MACLHLTHPILPSTTTKHYMITKPNRNPAVIRAQASSPGDQKRPWWAPLFKSINLHSDESSRVEDKDGQAAGPSVAAGHEEKRGEAGQGVKRWSGLTAEKARLLRRETLATETWHDAMYHSAIATRLASPDHN